MGGRANTRRNAAATVGIRQTGFARQIDGLSPCTLEATDEVRAGAA